MFRDLACFGSLLVHCGLGAVRFPWVILIVFGRDDPVRSYRLLIVWLALVVAFGVMPAAAAGDGVLPAGLQVAGEEEEPEQGEESDEDKDPIDVHDPQPPSAELAAESEPVPQGVPYTGPHSADVREIDTNGLDPIAEIVPPESVVVEIPAKADKAAIAGSPLKVVVDRSEFSKQDRPRARLEVNDGFGPPQGSLTPLFRVGLENPDGSAFSHEKPLRLELDVSDHVGTLQANLVGRLKLFYFDGCRVVENKDPDTEATWSETVCEVRVPVETTRGASGNVLTSVLDRGAGVGSGLVAEGTESQSLNSSGGWYGYGGSQGDSTGTYVATPFANVADYQVSLFTGSFTTAYPIPVPPSPGGPAPSVALSYSSASVDGMRSDRNNQPGPIGTGWSLGAGGSITRHFNVTCTNGTTQIQDPCPLDNEYSLTLNGTGSRLVRDSGNSYRLENDPMWRIARKTTGTVDKESHGEFWVVTTPDGTKYEFGTTDESLDHVPVYTANQPGPSCAGHEDPAWQGSITHVCYKAWRWNLSKVTDTFGNQMTFHYNQELDWYRVRTFSSVKGEVVRASHLEEIRYAFVNGSPRAKVFFNYEVRCKDPESVTNCDADNDLVDTPVDLACRASDSSCTNAYPSYFSELALGSIQTAVLEGGAWVTVGWWDLDQSYPVDNGPTSSEIASPAKLWLNEVTPRPGSDSKRSAFTQIEAEDRDTSGGPTGIGTRKSSDWGVGQDVKWIHDGDWLKFNRVDFGSGASKVLVRYSTNAQTGSFQFRLDSATGPLIATVPVDSSQNNWNEYVTAQVNVTGASGVRDLYVKIVNPGTSTQLAYFNWFRFKPSGTMSGLNPTVFEEAQDASGYYHKNRAENLPALKNVGRPPIRLPRIGKIITTLHGQVDVSYDQDHGWDSETGVCHQNAGNLYAGPECDYFATWYDGYRVHFNIWKVMSVNSNDAFTQNKTNYLSYTYSRPGWAATDTPGYSPLNTSCGSGPCNTYADFRGHENVTVWRGTSSSGTYSKEEHRFYQGLNGSGNYSGTKSIQHSDGSTSTDHDWLAGQSADVQQLDGGVWVTRTKTTYKKLETITGKAQFVGPHVVTTVWNQTGSDPKLTTTYDYDTYGNVDYEKYVSSNDGATNRLITREFVYNTSKWIVGAPKNETLWSGTTTGTANSADEKQFTKYYYQTSSATFGYGGAPLTGAVTRARVFSNRDGTDVFSDTDYTYDSMGRVTKVTDPNNNVVETGYSSSTGFATWVDNALNHRTTLVTDVGWGVPTKITDPNGNVTEVEYDDYGRTKKVWLPTESSSGAASLIFSYTLATSSSPARTKSRQLAETGPNVYLETYDYYDGFGRVVQSQSAAAASGQRIITSRFYSQRGALRRETAPHQVAGEPGTGLVTETWTGSSPSMPLQTYFVVDDLDRPIRTETIADDSAPDVLWSESVDYDGLITTTTDRMGVESRSKSDTFGNLREVTEYDDGDLTNNGNETAYTTVYSYNVRNNLTRILNSQDQAGSSDDIVINYDLLGRKTSMTDPDIGVWAYTYDANGNLETQTDARDQVIHFTYDALNRPTWQREDSATGPKIASWTYDKAGEKGLLDVSKSWRNNSVWVKVDPQGYDARGRVTSTRWDVYQTATGNWTVSQTYDEADRIDTLTYPSGETVTYSYDNRSGQATSLSSSVGDMIVSNATYTETGAPDQQLWGAGSQNIKAKWNYKADTQRLWKIKADTDTYGHTDLALLRYDYDEAGNITQLKDQKNANQVQCFEYDDLYRLKRAWISDDDTGTTNDCADGYQATGTGWYDRSYNYDPLGNVDSWENHLNNNTYDYTYAQTGNAGLHAATALTGAGGGSFGYDQNGNQTSRPGGDTLVFDAANRLASYTTPTKTTTFAYDADGARIVRDEGATETIYVGGIYETDGTEKRSYYSFAGQVVAYRLQASSTDERYYLISDHLGTNAHQITYSDSSRSSQYYLPFGGSRGVSGGGLDTDRTYTGQVSDETLTGLMFYNARYYDPLLRRFISPDTIVPDPGNPQDLNRYSYVRNNPVRYNDPTGRCQGPSGGHLYAGPCMSGDWALETIDALIADYFAVQAELERRGWDPTYDINFGFTLFSAPADAAASDYDLFQGYLGIVDDLGFSPRLEGLHHTWDVPDLLGGAADLAGLANSLNAGVWMIAGLGVLVCTGLVLASVVCGVFATSFAVSSLTSPAIAGIDVLLSCMADGWNQQCAEQVVFVGITVGFGRALRRSDDVPDWMENALYGITSPGSLLIEYANATGEQIHVRIVGGSSGGINIAV